MRLGPVPMLSWLLGTSFPCCISLLSSLDSRGGTGCHAFSGGLCFFFLNVEEEGGEVEEEGVDVKWGGRETRRREGRENYSQSVK